MKPALLIAGPTASGKSALALDIARKWKGVIINADALQVYEPLRILSARPLPDEEAQVPHRLYGHLPATAQYSIATWLNCSRRLARDWERLSRKALAFFRLASIQLMTRKLCNPA